MLPAVKGRLPCNRSLAALVVRRVIATNKLDDTEADSLNQRILALNKELEQMRLLKDRHDKAKVSRQGQRFVQQPEVESAESGTSIYKDDTMRTLTSLADPGDLLQQPVRAWDGCQAAAHVAYGMSDDCFIFPITPSSPMAELAEAWSQQGLRNVFGVPMRVSQLQSEAGAAGAVHGSLAMGGLSTTFTASQGLLLMIPNMYKIAGELMPCVFHVAARALAGEALSIFGDHQDVMAVRQTGWALLSSHTVQQSQDLALIAHLATLKARVPFVHFFDGFRTSHEIQSIETISYSDMWDMLDHESLAAQRARGLSPANPVMRGSNQNPDVYMQCLEASNMYYDAVPGIVQGAMDMFAERTGRKYSLFDYHGVPDAEYIVVQMGAGTDATKIAVDRLNASGAKVGLVLPHLFRPWSGKHFLQALDQGLGRLKRVAVLDRTKEAGGFGEPLLLDVMATVQAAGNLGHLKIVGGRWGLGSKEYTPGMAMAVFDNLMSDSPKERFTVGVQDDVTHLSLPLPSELRNTFAPDVKQCMFYGLSGDGTVGANKNAIKIIGKDPDKRVQGYFYYSSIKAGGPTISHLRFGSEVINAPWEIQPGEADYSACCFTEHINKYDVAKGCKEGSIFVLNCPWSTVEELDEHLPPKLRKTIAEKHLQFYVIDAGKVADESGMGKFTNNIMQTAFFRLSGVLPFEEAMRSFKEEVVKSYSKRGEEVVQRNLRSVDMALERLLRVDTPTERWVALADAPLKEDLKYEGHGAFIEEVVKPMNRLQGDSVPVSKFPVGGVMPLGTAAYEKRSVAPAVPDVDMDKCTQCNYCAYSCPHAVIRPFLLSQQEVDAAPKTLDSRKATSGDLAGYNFRIQVSAQDCTGCEVCVKVCPDDALSMISPAEVPAHGHDENWEYLVNLPVREDLVSKTSVKGSQFQQPLLEFHGACAGCGETPYVKLMTQLFGNRMVVANATGCSSIWGLPYGSSPYTTNSAGKGPAWANSLFEDNAEFGFGMVQNMAGRKERVKGLVQRALEEDGAVKSPELYAQLKLWLEKHDVPATACRLADSLPPLLEKEMGSSPVLQQIHAEKEALPKLSQWIVGGDGWAYDIGFGGLDHVLASGADVNILILDTEVYSNTGGQRSKATPMSAIAKFASGGKMRHKKDVGDMAMAYGDVYVASIAMGANMSQTVKAFVEADAYPGTSLIMSYAPCIEHKIKHADGLGVMMQGQKNAVESGYWPLFRYNPIKIHDGKNPFELDAKKLKHGLNDYLKTENRFDALRRADPKLYAQLEAEFARNVARRHAKYTKLAEVESTGVTGEPLSVLYGSETGTTQALAVQMAEQCRARGFSVQLAALDDVDLEELPSHKNVLLMVATCGEGALPQNCQQMWEQLSRPDLPPSLLEGLNYTVFALGDRNYHLFCKAGHDFDNRLAELGARRLLPMGIGDDQDEDKFETGWSEFLPSYWSTIDAPPDPTEHLIPTPAFALTKVDAREVLPGHRPMPPRSKLVDITFNDRISPYDYDRSIRHIEFDLESSGINYLLGDALTVYPTNDPATVTEFLDFYGLDGSQAVSIAATGNAMPDERKNEMFEQPLLLRQVFEEVIDIQGRPSKAFLKQLAKFASDVTEKAELEMLVGEEGIEKYGAEVAAETLTFFDLLKRFPSAKPTVEHLLTLLPCIKPRLYTIASSSRAHPGKARLTVVINDWETPSGKKRIGLCTDYLERIGEAGAPVKVACTMTSGTFNFPESNETPMVMVGLGTGVAPFIAFAQDRRWRRDRGEKNGPMWLFYGCRHKAKDYILGETLEALESECILTALRPAFSRDTAKKVYVQHRMVEEPEKIYTDLITKGGYFYLCGQAGQLEVDVKAALVTCFEKGGKLPKAKAEELLQQLMDEGRYCVELY